MQADKEEIRSRNDIVEVIGAVVQLQRRGRNWVGLCPFHQEKTPSFNVDPVTQTFKCFGCDTFGDVFTFVERHENMSFVEAAEHLARRAGVEFARHGEAPAQRGERDALYEANSVAVTYFQRTLERAQDARDYLARRNVLPQTIERFQLGYATEMWEGLVSYLGTRKVDLKVAAAAGLVHLARTGEYVDAFRRRVMFPIHDEQMRVVGFGGRALGDDPPKYLNTGETPVFVKSRLLYALPFARRRIADERRTLLMEGYMDVIAAHQAGFENAVASLGTAFTPDHARRLARLAPKAVVVYDGDSAGVKAALRAAAELEREDVSVRIVRLPEDEDPDSLIRSGHPELLARAVDAAATRVQMEIDLAISAADQSTDEGRQELIRGLIAILATIPSRSERDVYIERIWRLHPLSVHGPSVAKEQLHRDAEDAGGRSGRTTPAARQPFRRGMHDVPRRTVSDAPSSAEPARTPVSRPARRLLEEENLLIRAAASGEHRQTVLDLVEPEDLLDATDRDLLSFIRDHRHDLGPDEADLVRAIRSSGDEAFSAAAAVRLQESGASLSNRPIDANVLAVAAQAMRERRARAMRQRHAEALRRHLAQQAQARGELTEEDRERVRELHDVEARLKGSSNGG